MKLHTLQFLWRHLLEKQCCMGANKILTLEDYGYQFNFDFIPKHFKNFGNILKQEKGEKWLNM
jgi:hypothetical protein